MKRVYRILLQLGVLGIVASIIISCSKDDSPVDPGNGNNNTNNNPVVDTIRPTIFVHGFLSASDAWTPAVQLFRANGYQKNFLYTIDLTNYVASGMPDYDLMATQLETLVNSVLQQTGFKRVDLIAHSMGVNVVQYYITKKGGVDKVAHVVACAGAIDNSLTLNGSLTPSPVKFRTIRSDGYDATQNGDASKGSMPGADNQQIGGLDHQQIITNVNAFKAMYSFCVGKDPTKTSILPPAKASISGKVIDFVDNTPVAGATVEFYDVNPTDGTVYSLLERFTTDANGNWGSINKSYSINVLMKVEAPNHHVMYYFRQPFRDSSFTERLRVLPKAGGSPLLQQFRSALKFSTEHSMVVVFSPYRALYESRDSVNVNGVRVTNASTAPDPASGKPGSNTVSLFCFDETADKKSSTGPMANPMLNTFALNSYDLYIPAVPAGQAIPVIMNGKKLFTRNYRSEILPPATTNHGISIVQFEYW